jgi:hypothetical protein
VRPSGQKLTLVLLATITLEVTPFLEILPFFKCILEVVFCKDVQHHLRFCLNHLNRVKTEAFQFYLQSGKQRKVGWGGRTYVVFDQKFPCEKEVRDGALL